MVCWDRAQLQSSRNVLNKVERIAALSITGATRTTPTRALEVLQNLPPLHIHLQARAGLSSYKLTLTEIVAAQYAHKGQADIPKATDEYRIILMRCDLLISSVQRYSAGKNEIKTTSAKCRDNFGTQTVLKWKDVQALYIITSTQNWAPA